MLDSSRHTIDSLSSWMVQRCLFERLDVIASVNVDGWIIEQLDSIDTDSE